MISKLIDNYTRNMNQKTSSQFVHLKFGQTEITIQTFSVTKICKKKKDVIKLIYTKYFLQFVK